MEVVLASVKESVDENPVPSPFASLLIATTIQCADGLRTRLNEFANHEQCLAESDKRLSRSSAALRGKDKQGDLDEVDDLKLIEQHSQRSGLTLIALHLHMLRHNLHDPHSIDAEEGERDPRLK